jgi:hypothetical protein
VGQPVTRLDVESRTAPQPQAPARSNRSGCGPVSAVMDGRVVEGVYQVRGREITVSCRFGSASSETGGLPDADLAVMLLRDIIKAAKAGRPA